METATAYFEVWDDITDFRMGKWEVTTEITYPDLYTTVVKTKVKSPGRFKVTYKMTNGRVLAKLLFPKLAIEWISQRDLPGQWRGSVDIYNLCPGHASHFDYPSQSPEGVYPPDYPAPPAPSPGELMPRVWLAYDNVKLDFGMGPCADNWQGMSLACTSNFGYSRTIPCLDLGMPGIDDAYDLGEFPANLGGKIFTEQYKLVWDRNSFMYNTGTGDLYYPVQIATLLQSPAIGFRKLDPQPIKPKS